VSTHRQSQCGPVEPCNAMHMQRNPLRQVPSPDSRARTHARLPLRRGCAGMHAASALVCHRRWARMRDCVRVCASASYPQGYAGASSAPLAEAVEREPTDLGPRDEVRELRLGHLVALPLVRRPKAVACAALPPAPCVTHWWASMVLERAALGLPGLGCGVRTRMARRSESFRRHTIRRGTESIATPAAGGHEGDLGAAQTTDSGCSGWRSEGRGEDRRTTGQNSVEAARREREAGKGRPGATEGGVDPPCFPSSSSCTSPRIVFANRRIVSVYLSTAVTNACCMRCAARNTQHALQPARRAARERRHANTAFVFTLSFRSFRGAGRLHTPQTPVGLAAHSALAGGSGARGYIGAMVQGTRHHGAGVHIRRKAQH
jgi:hypothetical protein